MRIIKDTARVRVPATSATLGASLARIGMAHDLWNETTLRLTTGKARVKILGEGGHNAPVAEQHLTVRTMQYCLEKLGLPVAGMELGCTNFIPRECGLGEQSAEIVAGLLLVKAIVDEPEKLTNQVLLQLAANLVPLDAGIVSAIAGGTNLWWEKSLEPEKTADLTEVSLDGKEIAGQIISLPVAASLVTTILVPDSALQNVENMERQSLRLAQDLANLRAGVGKQAGNDDALAGEEIGVQVRGRHSSVEQKRAMEQVIGQVNRSSLLTYALTVAPQYLLEATEEAEALAKMQAQYPQSVQLLQALRKAGWPAVFSGTGNAILVFAAIDEVLGKRLKEQGFKVFASTQVSGAQILA